MTKPLKNAAPDIEPMSQEHISEIVELEHQRAFKKLKLLLRRLIKDGSVSQREIASRIGVSESQFSHIMSGRRNVSMRKLFSIAYAMHQRPEINYIPFDNLPPPPNATFLNVNEGWNALSPQSGTTTAPPADFLKGGSATSRDLSVKPIRFELLESVGS